jgi:hypothetical protein
VAIFEMLHSAPALTKHDLLFGVVGSNGPGTQFTYFTSTKVQILTPEELSPQSAPTTPRRIWREKAAIWREKELA